MKSGEIFKGIFALAVRLLGLVFLYFGLSAVPPLLDLGAIETAGRTDIASAALPIAFNLLVAWWLIGSAFLVRRAYPDAPGFSRHSHGDKERAVPASSSGAPQGPADLDLANQKLQSLVEKPK